MILDAYSLDTFQRCPRRWLLERSWRVIRWRPKSLFDSCLRQGIFQISNGSDPAAEIQRARTRFLSTAANPGLDLSEGADSWVVANDYAGMLSTVLTAVARTVLLTVQQLPPIRVTESDASSQWSPLSWSDESGTLHRWITVDAYDSAILSREAHSWSVFGDIVTLDAPLTLHVISIGQQRNGRRHSPWARAYKHPVIAHRYKFQRKNSRGHGTSLSEQWIPIWYADQPNPDPVTWVDLMDSDGITPTLLHHIPIAQPSEEVRRDTLDQLNSLATRMSRLVSEHPGPSDFVQEPMSRSACDSLVPCPHQELCYRERPGEGIAALGLHQRRAADASEPERRRLVQLATIGT
jgi:hypothetical protein